MKHLCTCGHDATRHYNNFIIGTSCRVDGCSCQHFVSNLPLIKCPHCSGKELTVREVSYLYAVVCLRCGASGGARETRVDAILAWNLRDNKQEVSNE